ncbi:cytochrome c maturation protein CcmE [Pseudoroseomonas rhizosphaerae]|uniref:Cytochrome c-type biogenesis protein CcmE n=1 Tax=Teichococcus rhizosphaerae TaxID=1335062 RepID=A0A2C7AD98_9PROT|nr:cytochrome c maturation protein CcmE [Pseudoroseomonas rhizosphaerae]PHK95076.1 cytochrome c maturation protein CcmE [Pseudoroseomonas rhizosphaerae]
MRPSRKRRRMWIVVLAGLGLGSATALTLTAFQDNLVFFLAPSDIAAKSPGPDRAFRLGGLVEAGSLQRAQAADGRTEARFRVTDGPVTIPVSYVGVLPDLFREGQGVVTLGKLGPDGLFRASEVLARHDETYMPPEVADALKRSGHWDPAQGAAPPAASWNTLSPDTPAPGAQDRAENPREQRGG